jgi:predicted nuclease of restriction endonuclease-like (RecB) superfamily
VIERLATDLRREFPDMKGFSPRNLLFMRAFAGAFADGAKVKQAVSLLPWGHVVRLVQKVKSAEEREWYASQASWWQLFQTT